MGKPRYMFRPCKGPVVVIHMDLLPEPPPTPEKFQRKARLRRLNQEFFQGRLTQIRWAAAREQVEIDYAEKP